MTTPERAAARPEEDRAGGQAHYGAGDTLHDTSPGEVSPPPRPEPPFPPEPPHGLERWIEPEDEAPPELAPVEVRGGALIDAYIAMPEVELGAHGGHPGWWTGNCPVLPEAHVGSLAVSPEGRPSCARGCDEFSLRRIAAHLSAEEREQMREPRRREHEATRYDFGRVRPDPAPAGPDATPDDSASNVFRRWTPRELLDADLTLRWKVKGLIAAPTFGMLGAPKKTLKSYVSTCIAIGLAAGRPVFDRFDVPKAEPVLVLVGEGGRIPFTRRMARIAARYGTDPREIPLATVFDVAPIGSERFRRSLDLHLEDVRPGLVILDPYYAFHGSEKDYRNLHEEGEQLTYLSSTCESAGASLIVNHHFNQTGNGDGLDRLSGAGGGEWADSWWFLKHREKADVEAGEFRLGLDVGSRQWGGTEWDLDFSVGRMNEETGEFEGALDWSIRRRVDEDGSKTSRVDKLILSTLKDHPFELTKTEVLRDVGGKKQDAMNTFDALALVGDIKSERVKREEKHGAGFRCVERELWALAREPVPARERVDL